MEIKLTQNQVATIDEIDADLAALKWHAWKAKHGRTFYAVRASRKPDRSRTTEGLHQVIARRRGIVGAPDHIDRNGLNNRRDNLRPDPKRLNEANVGLRANNTSGFKGVAWRKGKGKWRARININGKDRFLGYFNDPVEATKAYDRAALEARGEFAFLNFPAPHGSQDLSGSLTVGAL